MDIRIKTITVQATEDAHRVIRREAKRFGMNQNAIVAAMARLWESATDEQRSEVLGYPLVKESAA